MIRTDICLKNGTVICTDIHEKDDPIFNLIKHVLLYKNKFYLWLQTIETIYFDNHFFAYRIKLIPTFFSLPLDKIFSKQTSQININSKGEEFIIWDN